MLADLVKRNRSRRRFDHSRRVRGHDLEKLIELTRFVPSSGNLQPLKYLLVHEEKETDALFRMLKWARYLQDWSGPGENERPAAYIVVLGDTGIAPQFQYDAGIAAQTILLGATEMGLGGCIIASIDRDALRDAFALPGQMEILIAIALGYPVETVTIDNLPPGGDIKYYRTTDGIHHVPKRTMEELIVRRPDTATTVKGPE